ncbi:MAG: hypothetical protein QM477_11725 [Planctomycetota bacterium]
MLASKAKGGLSPDGSEGYNCECNPAAIKKLGEEVVHPGYGAVATTIDESVKEGL